MYLIPGTFKFEHKTNQPSEKKTEKRLPADYSAEKYPELYRKVKISSEYVKGSNLECPEPFQIGTLNCFDVLPGLEPSSMSLRSY